MNELEFEFNRLPEPELPDGLAAGIAARIARLDEERKFIASTAPSRAAAANIRDRLAWVAALVGVTVAVAAQTYQLIVGETTFDLTSLRIGDELDGVVAMLPATPAVGVLAAGLLLYLAGLFAPPRGAVRGG